jgi:hypothetical protein
VKEEFLRWLAMTGVDLDTTQALLAALSVARFSGIIQVPVLYE